MIPVFEPHIAEEEISAVVDALRRGEISGSFGKCIPEFEEKFASYCGVRHGIAVSNGTTALQLAVAAANLPHGFEALVSASTIISTPLAAFREGGTVVPIDSEPRTWNLDLDLLEEHASPRTRMVMPVHHFGHCVDMDRLMALADQHGWIVIEDAAEAHGAECRGRKAGSFGHMACFSFYANKIITTGEGGMVLTDDDALASRLRSLRNLAFGTPRFLHQEAGFNFRMTGYQAAMGASQCERIESIIAQKRRVASIYNKELEGIPHLYRPGEEPWARHVYWMYGVALDQNSPVTRDDLAVSLRERRVDTRTFFCPVGQQPFLKEQAGLRETPCPIADWLWESGLYLPSSPKLEDEQIRWIAKQVRECLAP